MVPPLAEHTHSLLGLVRGRDPGQSEFPVPSVLLDAVESHRPYAIDSI